MGEEAGHYTIVSKGGKQVAALSPAQDPGPPRWTTYINVDDVDAVAKNAEAAGGTIVVAPMDVMGAGRMAIFQDTTGAFIAAWQPGDHIGAQLVNEPGSITWNELSTSDSASRNPSTPRPSGGDGVAATTTPKPRCPAGPSRE